MSRHLPVRFNPFKAAELDQFLTGQVKLKGMKRLQQALAEEGGEALCEVTLSKPGPREYRLKLRVKAELPLQCQRCLEVYSEAVESESELALVQTEAQAELVPEDLEPFLVEDEVLDIQELVEEELLLSMPAIPRHSDIESCAHKIVREFDEDEIDEAEAGDEAKPNPFAVLGDLKDH